MARAYGSNAHLLMKRETVYGQAATGNYIRVPFNRCNLGSEQGLIDDPVLGHGRDPLAPLQDVINDEGDIVVPVDPRYLGLWLTGLFGDPDTTDNLDGSWDHEFASGGDDLPSYTIEVGIPKVPAFFVHAGVKLNSIALARRAVEAIERQTSERAEAGLPLDGLASPAPESAREQRPITVVVNVTAADASSFRASQGQIAADMARAIDRASRNR
jgi:hypothetical protein